MELLLVVARAFDRKAVRREDDMRVRSTHAVGEQVDERGSSPERSMNASSAPSPSASSTWPR